MAEVASSGHRKTPWHISKVKDVDIDPTLQAWDMDEKAILRISMGMLCYARVVAVTSTLSRIVPTPERVVARVEVPILQVPIHPSTCRSLEPTTSLRPIKPKVHCLSQEEDQQAVVEGVVLKPLTLHPHGWTQTLCLNPLGR